MTRHRVQLSVALVISAITFLMEHPALAQEPGWGSVAGRFVLDGDAPVPAVLDIERDAEICGKIGLVDESLVVDPDSLGIRYVAVWLDDKTPAIHPDLKELPSEASLLDNHNCRFEPRMQVVRTGRKLVLKNSDPVAHNAAVFVKRSTPFNEVIPVNQLAERSIPKAELLPVRVDCSIHSWMKAWLIVTDHPYATVSDANGRFELTNLPAGDVKLRFWHERPGLLGEVHQGSATMAISKGTVTLKIVAGESLDLGDLRIPAAAFAKKK